MKKTIRGIFFGKSPLLSGLIAIAVIGAIVLGCTCNEKDGFKWRSENTSSDSNRAADDGDSKDTGKPAKKSDASKGEIPEGAELEGMVKDTLMDFDNALKTEDFSDFYDGISDTWQKQTSPRQLKKLFQSFIDGKADVSGIKDLTPEYSKTPAIRESSGLEMLEVDGEFPTNPNPTSFELKYIAEGKEWKLGGIFVRTTLYNSQ
jgi:hypothetical protein